VYCIGAKIKGRFISENDGYHDVIWKSDPVLKKRKRKEQKESLFDDRQDHVWQQWREYKLKRYAEDQREPQGELRQMKQRKYKHRRRVELVEFRVTIFMTHWINSSEPPDLV